MAMNAALSTYLSARAARALPKFSVDDVFDMMSDATRDPSGLAKDLGLPDEQVPQGHVVAPLLDGYLDDLAADDGGVLSAVAARAVRDSRSLRRRMADATGVASDEVVDAFLSLDAGDASAFDRLASDFYGA